MARSNKVSKPRTQRIKPLEIIETGVHTRAVVSLIDARIKVTGKYSGQEYLFEKAGSVINADERDVEWLLSKRQGERQCCGGTEKGNKVFDLA